MAIVDRMIRAAKGDVNLFEEVEHDPGATTEALIVVAVVAVAEAIGAAIAASMTRGGHPVSGIISGLVIGIIGWAVFAGITYFIGTRLFNADATWEEVLRTLGYAHSPNIVSILVFIPILGGLVALVAGVWALYLGFVAIRSALDISSGQTVATILLSIIPAVIVVGIISWPLAMMRI